MIRAVVRYVEDGKRPPPELKAVLQWRTWGALPEAGGTRDQRAGDLDRMLSAANIYDLWKAHKAGKLKEMTQEQKTILIELKEWLQAN